MVSRIRRHKNAVYTLKQQFAGWEKDVESRVPLTILLSLKPPTQILPFLLKIILVVPTVVKVHPNLAFRRCRVARERANEDRELALVYQPFVG